MKTRNTYILLLSSILSLASCNGQTKVTQQLESSSKNQLEASNKEQMDKYELTPETAHPKAKKLMAENFYWSPIEESGPFGSDDGSDAFYGFKQWRLKHQNVSPIVYLKELIEQWNYLPFDLYELNEDYLKKYISSSQVGDMLLIGQDNAIIAIGFGQFLLEGKIDEDIKALTKIALTRELLPGIIGMWEGEYKKTRIDQLTKMMATVDKMNE